MAFALVICMFKKLNVKKTFTFTCSLFLMFFINASLSHGIIFPQCGKTFFIQVSGQWVSFVWKCLYFTFILEGYFGSYRYLGCLFPYVLQTSKIVFHCLLGFIVSQKEVVIWIFVSCSWVFSFGCFQYFFFIFDF